MIRSHACPSSLDKPINRVGKRGHDLLDIRSDPEVWDVILVCLPRLDLHDGPRIRGTPAKDDRLASLTLFNRLETGAPDAEKVLECHVLL